MSITRGDMRYALRFAHSWRRAFQGSILAARRAGSPVDTNATPATKAIGFFAGQGRPPPGTRTLQPALPCQAKRQPGFAGTDQLCHRPCVPGNPDGFTFFDQFKEPGELGLGFMNIDLHTLSLVSFS